MILTSLTLKNWQGARNVQINNLSNKCILVGQNGTGKTSILNAIGVIFGEVKYREKEYEKNNSLISCRFKSGEKFSLNESRYTCYKDPNHNNYKWFRVSFKTINLTPVHLVVPELNKKCDKLIINKTSELLNEKIIYKKGSPIFEFGKGGKFYERDLSEGQKQYASTLAKLLIYRECNPEKTINLLVDSPECHFHPSLLETYLNHLHDICFPHKGPHGQIIIASHSPILLSILESYDVYRISKFTENNQYLEGNYDDRNSAYIDLIGDKLLKALTTDLLEVQRTPQFYKFFKECLSDYPVQGKAPKGDSQRLQITSFLASKVGTEIKILDFGAGVGRNLSAIYDSLSHHFSKIDYIAYEPNSRNYKELRTQADRINEKKIKTCNHIDEICAKFDIIIMSNVLHEVEVKDIEEIFKYIHGALKQNGFLIIQEHQLIAGEPSYLLFNDDELNQIFKTGGSPIESTKSGIDLLFYCINRSMWASPPSKKDIIVSLNMVSTRCKNEIKRLRGQEKLNTLSQREILQHAFYYGLHVNTSIAIDELTEQD